MEKKHSLASSHNSDGKSPISELEPAISSTLGKNGGQMSKQLDVSLALPGMLGEHDDEELDPVEARRVKRKLDRRILPLLML
ncbi:11937_t:CDS:1, partial [Acaulospora colombiana]